LRHTDPPNAGMRAGRSIAGAPDSATAIMVMHDAGGPAAEAVMSGDLHGLVEDVLRVPVSTWRTEPATNTFPRLPVLSTSAYVWTADFGEPAEMAAALNRLRAHSGWTRWAGTYCGVIELMRLRPVLTGDDRP
jgi:hypothetical protein